MRREGLRITEIAVAFRALVTPAISNFGLFSENAYHDYANTVYIIPKVTSTVKFRAKIFSLVIDLPYGYHRPGYSCLFGKAHVPDDKILEDEFLVDEIFPTRRIHIISGPVGVGKSTLEYQLIRACLDNSQFLGKQTHNEAGVVFLSADRTRRESHATLRRMGMLDLVPRIKWIFPQELRSKKDAFLETMIVEHTKPGQVLFVEPLAYFLRDGNNRMGNTTDYGHVSHFLSNVKHYVEENNITLICSLHPAKTKGADGYAAIREKVLGSTSWAGFTDTVLFLDPTDPGDPKCPYRTLYVLTRNHGCFSLDYMQEPEHGLLVPVTMTKPFKSALDIALAEWATEEFTLRDVEEWQARAEVSWKTAERWLTQKSNDGYVERIARGKYKKRVSS